ncbi:4'-phosphopantetheinyl transferase family protein [Castellaniella sp. WN]
MHAPDTSAPYRLVLSRGLPDEAGAARLRRDLPEAERRWIDRLRRPDDRLRSLIGRALARRLLGRRLDLAPENVPLRAGPRGKPMLAGGDPGEPPSPGGGAPAPGTTHSAWHFNIAHSGDLVLVGVGPGPLGVDVEHCPDHVDADLWRLATGHPLPAPGGPGIAPDPQAFCAQWVRREAILKTCGLGLAAGPGALRLAVAEATGWEPVSGRPEVEGLWVRLLWAFPDHCAALCLRGAAPPMPAACGSGRHDAPPPDAWSLRTLALADWIDGPD